MEIAIKSEIEAQKMYKEFLELDTPKEFEDRIKNFVKNEKNHEKILRNIFDDWYPEEDPKPVKKSVSIEGQIKSEDNDLLELLEKAMEDERNSEKTYSKLGDRVEDKAESRVFKYLAYMEREHFEILKNELEKLKE